MLTQHALQLHSVLSSSSPMSSSISGVLLGKTAIVPSLLSSSALPPIPVLLAATSTSLFGQTTANDSSDQNPSSIPKTTMFSPRVRSSIWMALAMALHFGGYEFARSGVLALFTSAEMGFSHHSAYPFAMGLVTPVSLGLLYWYGVLLKAKGPRTALKTTKGLSLGILLIGTIVLTLAGQEGGASTIWTRLIVAALFVFQNSYGHLIYTQQWSFLGSIMTPTEGTKWFSAIAGVCSIVCTLAGTLVHRLASVVGLLGLVQGTAVTLFLSLLFADRAYRLSEIHGFQPSETNSKKKSSGDDTKEVAKERSLLWKIAHLFQRVPTLAALFLEVISFQSLSTVLNVCFVRQLKEQVPLDTDRASYTGQFYAIINGVSAIMQFIALPLARKFLEPKLVYRLMPLILLPLLLYSSIQHSTLTMAAITFFMLKMMDYSLRNVVNEMVYQPLDFESRYLGKEVIGVFANRFGKSGMSLILSFLTPLGVGTVQLSQLAVAIASLWGTASLWLSGTLVSNADAERLVQERNSRKDSGGDQAKED